MAVGSAVLSFGAGAFDAKVDFADATVGAGTKIEAYIQVPASDAPRMRDEYWLEALEVRGGNAQPGVGGTIYGKSTFGKIIGDFTIQWVTL